MPVSLTSDASAVYTALIAKQGMTSRVRSLSADIKTHCESSEALNWAADLTALGFAIPAKDAKDESGASERESFAKSLGTAFGAVASEVAGRKLSARVEILDTTAKDESGKTVATVEVAVAFRAVKPRSK